VILFRSTDLWDDRAFGNPGAFSVDRLHLSPTWHRRVAAHVLSTLGLAPEGGPAQRARPVRATVLAGGPGRGRPLGRAVPRPRAAVRRWLTGRSSGDLRTPKRPELSPLTD
jgi:hypothetical protein